MVTLPAIRGWVIGCRKLRRYRGWALPRLARKLRMRAIRTFLDEKGAREAVHLRLPEVKKDFS